MASILGGCLMAAHGAERIVVSLRTAFGPSRTPFAFLGSGLLLGIPMFAEAVFYLLLPLAKAMWRETRRNYLLFVMTIVAGATMTHSLVPPTPGPLFVAQAMGIDIALMMQQGLIVSTIAALAGYAYARYADRRWPLEVRSGPAGEVETPEASAMLALLRTWNSLPSREATGTRRGTRMLRTPGCPSCPSTGPNVRSPAPDRASWSSTPTRPLDDMSAMSCDAWVATGSPRSTIPPRHSAISRCRARTCCSRSWICRA